MKNMELYERYRAVPESAKKRIAAGRTKGFTDINPMWRIKCLTEAFGPCGVGWYIKPLKKWIEQFEDETAAFVDIELYVKVDGEWSAPISGTGGSRFATKERGGVYVSDECYKMATTDAISVACKMLGIGADVYWSSDKTKYGVWDEQPDNSGAAQSNHGSKTLNNRTSGTGAVPNGEVRQDTPEDRQKNAEMAAKANRELIDRNKIAALKSKMAQESVPANEVLSRFKRRSFDQMTVSEWDSAMRILDKMRDKRLAREKAAN